MSRQDPYAMLQAITMQRTGATPPASKVQMQPAHEPKAQMALAHKREDPYKLLADLIATTNKQQPQTWSDATHQYGEVMRDIFGGFITPQAVNVGTEERPLYMGRIDDPEKFAAAVAGFGPAIQGQKAALAARETATNILGPKSIEPPITQLHPLGYDPTVGSEILEKFPSPKRPQYLDDLSKGLTPGIDVSESAYFDSPEVAKQFNDFKNAIRENTRSSYYIQQAALDITKHGYPIGVGKDYQAEDVKHAIVIMNNINQAPPIEEELYRGISIFGKPTFEKGQSIELPAASTSTNRSVAGSFANSGAGINHPVIFEIQPGAKGIPLNKFSLLMEEEVLSGGTFEVLDVKTEPHRLKKMYPDSPEAYVVKVKQTNTFKLPPPDFMESMAPANKYYSPKGSKVESGMVSEAKSTGPTFSWSYYLPKKGPLAYHEIPNPIYGQLESKNVPHGVYEMEEKGQKIYQTWKSGTNAGKSTSKQAAIEAWKKDMNKELLSEMSKTKSFSWESWYGKPLAAYEVPKPVYGQDPNLNHIPHGIYEVEESGQKVYKTYENGHYGGKALSKEDAIESWKKFSEKPLKVQKYSPSLNDIDEAYKAYSEGQVPINSYEDYTVGYISKEEFLKHVKPGAGLNAPSKVGLPTLQEWGKSKTKELSKVQEAAKPKPAAKSKPVKPEATFLEKLINKPPSNTMAYWKLKNPKGTDDQYFALPFAEFMTLMDEWQTLNKYLEGFKE